MQSESILDQATPALERMIGRDKNHPAVIIWSMCNESQTAQRSGHPRDAQTHPPDQEVGPVPDGDVCDFTTGIEGASCVRGCGPGGRERLPRFVLVEARHSCQPFGELGTRPAEEFIRRRLAAWPDKPLLIKSSRAAVCPESMATCRTPRICSRV